MGIKTEFITAVPETAEGKRAYVEGLAHAVDHLRAYAAELFLRGDPRNEVSAERTRDLANDLMLKGAKIIEEAQALEVGEKVAHHAELMSSMEPPPTNPYTPRPPRDFGPLRARAVVAEEGQGP